MLITYINILFMGDKNLVGTSPLYTSHTSKYKIF